MNKPLSGIPQPKRAVTFRKIDGQVVVTIPDAAVPGVASLLTIASGSLMDISEREQLIQKKLKYEKAANEAVSLADNLTATLAQGNVPLVDEEGDNGGA